MLPPFGLYAKIDASLASLLGPRDLAALAEAGAVADVAGRLGEKPGYAPYLAGLGGLEPHARQVGYKNRRGEIERALARKPMVDLMELIPFATCERRAFLLALLRGCEAENVKRTIRRIWTATRPSYTSPVPERRLPPDPVLYDLGLYASVTPDRLRELATGSLAGLVTALADTPFGRCLANARASAEASGTTFPLESAIDDDMLAARYRAAGRLGAADRTATRALLGTEADLLALLWIYRGRCLLNFPPEEVIPRLPGFGRRLSLSLLRALAGVDDATVFARHLASSPYAALLEEDGSVRADRIDMRAAAILVAEARAVRAGWRFDMGQVLAYLILVEREIHDIGSIVECAHYRLDRGETSEHVVGGLP